MANQRKTTKTPESSCWHCGTKFTAASDLSGNMKTPTAGSCSICIMCAAPSIFMEDLTLRKPTQEEIDEILQSEQAAQLILAVAAKNAMARLEKKYGNG